MRALCLFTVALAGAIVPSASASILLSVSLDTSPLIGHPAGPFSLEFQFNDGGSSADNNGDNTALLSDFNFGGGQPAGAPSTIGFVSGNLATSITMMAGSTAVGTFFNQFIQQFVPGSRLDFRLALTTNVETNIPDEFTFAILDRTGSEIPTSSPFDVLLQIDVSRRPSIQTFATDPSRPPAGGGPGIDIAAPAATALPEPNLSPVLAVLLLGAALRSLRPRKRTASPR